jgi:hypothetical protein
MEVAGAQVCLRREIRVGECYVRLEDSPWLAC